MGYIRIWLDRKSIFPAIMITVYYFFILTCFAKTILNFLIESENYCYEKLQWDGYLNFGKLSFQIIYLYKILNTTHCEWFHIYFESALYSSFFQKTIALPPTTKCARIIRIPGRTKLWHGYSGNSNSKKPPDVFPCDLNNPSNIHT